MDCEYRPHIPSQLKNNKASIWLYKSIENHSLSQKLSWLLSDKEHLSSAYNDYSLMRQQKYAEALLTCLRAVERNQPTLLCEIDPYLFLSKIGAKEFHKLHRRCSSYPDSHLRTNRNKNVTNFLEIKEKFKDEIEGAVRNADLKLFGKLKPWKSLPSLRTQDVELLDKNKFLGTSRTTPSTPVNVRVKEQRNSVVQNSGVKKKYLKRGTCKKSVRSKSNVIVNNVVEYTPPLSSSQDSRGNDEMENYMKRTKSPIHKFMPDFTAKAGQKDYKRHPKKSFIEDGGMKVQPVATRYRFHKINSITFDLSIYRSY